MNPNTIYIFNCARPPSNFMCYNYNYPIIFINLLIGLDLRLEM
jgi:hypothetical protein